MQAQAKWVGGGEYPLRWRFKKDIPEHLKAEAYRIDFGLYGIAYVARDTSGSVLMNGGGRAQTFDFWLKTPGHVIGHRDIQAANHLPWGEEWRAAAVDRISDELKTFIDAGGRH